MRLTPAERVRLEREAGETPLTTYIKLRLFNKLPPLSIYANDQGGVIVIEGWIRAVVFSLEHAVSECLGLVLTDGLTGPHSS